MPTGFRQLEWLIRARLRSGLAAIRETPALLDTMFPDLSANSRTQLADWLATTEIGCELAFPLDMAQVPCWTIHMVGETPVYEPVGQSLHESYDATTQEYEAERGEYVRKAYQIHTLTGHPDQTIVLAAILQHILKTLKQPLALEGFYEMRTAQEDALDFKLDYLPVRLYARVTYVSVLVEDTFVAVEPSATSVVVGTQHGMDANGYIEVNFT